MSKITSQTKHIPKDAQVIISMLKDMGITDYEPRVVNQLLEFTYRYVTCTLDDARVFANHAKKKSLDLDDVTLAVQLQLDRRFTNPPSRDILLEVARAKNNVPLPMIKPHCGIRLPPDRYSLNSCNYKLRNYKKQLSKQNPLGAPISLTSHPRIQLTPGSMISGSSQMKVHQMPGNTQGSGSKSTSLVSSSPSVSIVNSSGHGRTVALVGKNPGGQQTTHKVITVPKPVIKFSAGTSSPSIVPKIQISAGTMPSISTAASTATSNSAATATPMIITSEGSGGIKRKREDDYDDPE
ncbi:transcription initiation factor TFIID subunit 9 [Ischnura elegans]|uniref:transcription initiation factor TFIID subunit 9 n=1 Tax=Ischnura elegans TaxID=197161 RepID=UPI001ED872BA|nr:transcription initiation factor TFIID subunit 9 [Ischnura elegans]